MPDLANAKGKLGDLAKGKLGNLSKGNLGDLSSMMDGKMPDLANAKGKLGDLSSMMDGFKNNNSKITNLAKDKFKALVP